MSEEEAVLRLKNNGKNSVFKEERLSSVKIFLNQFKNPLIYILVGAGILTFFIGDFTDSALFSERFYLIRFSVFFKRIKPPR